jgi:hypothetical protein
VVQVPPGLSGFSHVVLVRSTLSSTLSADEDPFILATGVGTLIEPRNLERTFKWLVARHGLPALGHATHAMTVDLYGDAIDGTER